MDIHKSEKRVYKLVLTGGKQSHLIDILLRTFACKCSFYNIFHMISDGIFVVHSIYAMVYFCVSFGHLLPVETQKFNASCRSHK